jgi:hypothetical protein
LRIKASHGILPYELAPPHNRVPGNRDCFIKNMLSTRGRKYAALDLAASYTKDRGQPYDKTKHPAGLVSFRNAENVSMRLPPL